MQEISVSLIAELQQLVGLLLLFRLVGHEWLKILLDQVLPELHLHPGKVVDLTGAEISVFDPIWVDYEKKRKCYYLIQMVW